MAGPLCKVKAHYRIKKLLCNNTMQDSKAGMQLVEGKAVEMEDVGRPAQVFVIGEEDVESDPFFDDFGHDMFGSSGYRGGGLW